MPRADVVVVGAGLSGLACALHLAEGGARVQVVAAGQTASHWAAGPIDVAAVPGAPTSRAALGDLAARPGHPYGLLAEEVEPALTWLLDRLAAEGLTHVGDLDARFGRLPTALGLTRPAAIAPAAMAAALPPWRPGERLVVVGFGGFKDLWPVAVAASLRRPAVWVDAAETDLGAGRREAGTAGSVARASGPETVAAVLVELPELAGRRNLNALHLAGLLDHAASRDRVLDAVARAVDRLPGPPARIALPAVLGLHDHAAVVEAARARLPWPFFELPIVPPSLPGMRLVGALRAALRRRGGRIQLGEAVARVELDDGRIQVVLPAAARELVVRAAGLVLATGGISGGGLTATPDGRLHETVLGLPVEAPPSAEWLAADPFEPEGHPLEAAGIRTDRDLRPLDLGAAPAVPDLRVVGSLLAGQRYLRQRCGDGIAVASARRAAESLLGQRSIAEPPTADGPPARGAAA